MILTVNLLAKAEVATVIVSGISIVGMKFGLLEMICHLAMTGGRLLMPHLRKEVMVRKKMFQLNSFCTVDRNICLCKQQICPSRFLLFQIQGILNFDYLRYEASRMVSMK